MVLMSTPTLGEPADALELRVSGMILTLMSYFVTVSSKSVILINSI